VCCKWFDWLLTDFIHGTLSLSNTYFRQHFLNKITDAQRQSELFMHELLDLREHSSILTNGMTLLRSEIDSLIASVCCT